MLYFYYLLYYSIYYIWFELWISGELTVIGFSQGTSATFALLSSKPEYFSKMNLYIALAPIVYFTRYNPLRKNKLIGPFITQNMVRIAANGQSKTR